MAVAELSVKHLAVSLRSVSMKINTKLGGINVKLAGLRTPAGTAWPAGMGSKPFMILGAVRLPYRHPHIETTSGVVCLESSRSVALTLSACALSATIS